MINTKEREYRMSLTEVNYILMFSERSITERIPEKFKKFLDANEAIDYFPRIDMAKPLEEQELKQYTLMILALIYKDFVCDKDQKEEYNALIRKAKLEEENKYSYENLFKNKYNSVEKEEKVSSNLPTVIEKENLFTKLKNWIWKFFRNRG